MFVSSSGLFMLQTLRLLLPAIIPSWRFFDAVTASPRIEYALVSSEDSCLDWQEFRPRPARLSIGRMLGRMIWNPRWNESLFLVSCAERLIDVPTGHSVQEIGIRIGVELVRQKAEVGSFQYRLAFVSRDGAQLQRDIVFISPVYSLNGKA